MSTAAQSLLTGVSPQGALFSPTSRYFGLPVKTMTTADGAAIVYVSRRFVPQASQFALLQIHIVTQGERLDNIANQYLGDPTAFWNLCDANNAMRPEELTETLGRQLRITLPQGIPAQINA